MLMPVLTATEEELVAFWGKRFSNFFFPAYFTESKDVPSVSRHFVCYVFNFSCCSHRLEITVPVGWELNTNN